MVRILCGNPTKRMLVLSLMIQLLMFYFLVLYIFHDISGSPVVSSLTYNTTSGVVTCISIGGPATTVTWSRSGLTYQQSKIVVDTVNATYHNLLSITSSQISDYTGIFTCTVNNSRGSDISSTAEFKGNIL